MKTFAEKIIDSMVDENGHCGERGLSVKQFDILYKHLKMAETIDRGGWNGSCKFVPFSEDIWEGTIGRYNVILSCYHHFNDRCSVVSINKWINELPSFESSEYIGKVKQKVDKWVIFIGESSYVREAYSYGSETVYVYKFMDAEDNLLVWKTTCSLGYYDKKDMWHVVKPGETLKIKGTIKTHDEYKGIKQTVLARCKVSSCNEVLFS